MDSINAAAATLAVVGGVLGVLIRRQASGDHDQKHLNTKLRRMCLEWRNDLTQNVMPFWLKHSLDETYGGYFTDIDEDGTVLDRTKYHWLQGRQVWTLSRLFNTGDFGDTETRSKWFKAAALGAKFLRTAKKKGEDNDGLFFFSTTRDGCTGIHYQRKPYTAVFYLLGCLEFSQALRQQSKDMDAEYYLQEALDTFDKVERWMGDPTLCGRLPTVGQRPVLIQTVSFLVESVTCFHPSMDRIHVGFF